MTLVTVFLAWLPVAILFAAWAWLAQGRKLTGRLAVAVLAEAGVLTLLAGLWFGSLGHGGWWLVFLLVGALVNGAERAVRVALTPGPGRPEWRAFALGIARYVAAGALFAWRLG